MNTHRRTTTPPRGSVSFLLLAFAVAFVVAATQLPTLASHISAEVTRTTDLPAHFTDATSPQR